MKGFYFLLSAHNLVSGVSAQNHKVLSTLINLFYTKIGTLWFCADTPRIGLCEDTKKQTLQKYFVLGNQKNKVYNNTDNEGNENSYSDDKTKKKINKSEKNWKILF